MGAKTSENGFVQVYTAKIVPKKIHFRWAETFCTEAEFYYKTGRNILPGVCNTGGCCSRGRFISKISHFKG
jgi:hypothetical protein